MGLGSVSPIGVLMVLIAVTAAAGTAEAQTITDLGIPPGEWGVHASSVSRDGTTAIGTSFSSAGDRTFRWTRWRGAEDLGAPSGASGIWGNAVSGDGEAVACMGFMSGSPIRSFRWTRRGSFEDLGVLVGAAYGTEAYGINHDGSVIAGTASVGAGYDYHAFRWTRRRGLQDLGTLPGGSYTFGTAISGDGESVTGLGNTAAGEYAYVWRGGVMRALDGLQPEDYSGGTAINADGSVIVGYSGSNAVLWTNGAVQDLGVLPGGSYSVAYAVSGDGRVVGGLADTATGASVATLWTDATGTVDLNTYLPTQGVDLRGWQLSITTGLSGDGTTLVGDGTFNGESRAWIVSLPRRHACGGHGRVFNSGRHSHTCPVRRPGRFSLPRPPR